MLGGLILAVRSLQPKFSKLKPLPELSACFRRRRRGTAKAVLKSRWSAALPAFISGITGNKMMRLMAGVAVVCNGECAGSGWTLRVALVVLGVIPMVGFDVFFQIFSHLKNYACRGRTFATNLKGAKAIHIGAKIRQNATRRRAAHDGRRYCRKRTSCH